MLMPSALEAGREEGIDNSLGQFRIGSSAGQTKNVGVIMLAGQMGHLLVPDEGSASAGHFVGGDTHANARRANQETKTMTVFGHAASHRLGVIRVIGGFFGSGAEIGDGDASLLQVMLEQFF